MTDFFKSSYMYLSEKDWISLLSCLVPVPFSVRVWFGASRVRYNMVSQMIILVYSNWLPQKKTWVIAQETHFTFLIGRCLFVLSFSVLSHIAWSSLSLHCTTSTKCQPLFTRQHLLKLSPNPPARAKGRTEVLTSSVTIAVTHSASRSQCAEATQSDVFANRRPFYPFHSHWKITEHIWLYQ